jgi:hypothetical protein
VSAAVARSATERYGAPLTTAAISATRNRTLNLESARAANLTSSTIGPNSTEAARASL